jgi:hypothetical protein
MKFTAEVEVPADREPSSYNLQAKIHVHHR